MFSISPDVRFLIDEKDGGVLLDIAKGKCFSINPVGARIWNLIAQDSEKGVGISFVVHSIAQLYDLSAEQVEEDVSRFLSELTKRGMLISPDSTHFRRNGDPPRSLLSSRSDASCASTALASVEGTAGGESGDAKLVDSFLGLGLLVIADIRLLCGGFRGLYSLVKCFPRRHCRGDGHAPQEAEVRAICSAVDRANRWYWKSAWCLQRSAATACLLRYRGVDAQLIIGCHKLPFQAHAWVEVNGTPVNDFPNIGKFYSPIDAV